MALAEALEVQKGEFFEWTVQDRHTFILKRVSRRKLKTTK
jgi:antitoxin component of MazEF toxin-antitoxin module